jgi:hypothetical protein
VFGVILLVATLYILLVRVVVPVEVHMSSNRCISVLLPVLAAAASQLRHRTARTIPLSFAQDLNLTKRFTVKTFLYESASHLHSCQMNGYDTYMADTDLHKQLSGLIIV